MTAPVNSSTLPPTEQIGTPREITQSRIEGVTQIQPPFILPQEAQPTRATVTVSERAAAGQVMAQGAAFQGNGLSDAAIQELAQQIAAGIYRPPPAAIAQALVRHEARILKGD